MLKILPRIRSDIGENRNGSDNCKEKEEEVIDILEYGCWGKPEKEVVSELIDDDGVDGVNGMGANIWVRDFLGWKQPVRFFLLIGFERARRGKRRRIEEK